MRKIDSKMENT